MSEKRLADASVVVVGGGFAGVACAKELGRHNVRVTLIDKNNYHQFQPLLYQLASAQLAPGDIARPIRGVLLKYPSCDVKQTEVTSIGPDTLTLTTSSGLTFTGDYLVLAMG